MLIQDITPAQKLRTNRKAKLRLRGRVVAIITT